MDKNTMLRSIPKVDEILCEDQILELIDNNPREIIIESIRYVIDEFRNAILSFDSNSEKTNIKIDDFTKDDIVEQVINRVNVENETSLHRMINATGVVLHTNLGRALMPQSASNAVAAVTSNYSNLEYNVLEGKRGSRHDHIEKIICKITGAEAAMVVNNNAAATMLCLSSMGENMEVIVSRGELVEIGGSFRIPEIMKRSGCILKEIGTTNKTKVSDYKNAVSEDTGAILKVHTSNYKILGFTEEATLDELVELGKEIELPVIYDMGSGLMVDMKKYGVQEPTVKECINSGIDVILFSGDKLLGGPQGGIIAGKKKYIDEMKKHQLARVVRIDKMSLAALEATFREYISETRAFENIPTLRMLKANFDELFDRADIFSKKLSSEAKGFIFLPEETHVQVGGGSAPTVLLKSAGVAVTSERVSITEIEKRLRMHNPPIVTRISKDKLYIEMRTITNDEENIIIDAFKKIEV